MDDFYVEEEFEQLLNDFGRPTEKPLAEVVEEEFEQLLNDFDRPTEKPLEEVFEEKFEQLLNDYVGPTEKQLEEVKDNPIRRKRKLSLVDFVPASIPKKVKVKETHLLDLFNNDEVCKILLAKLPVTTTTDLVYAFSQLRYVGLVQKHLLARSVEIMSLHFLSSTKNTFSTIFNDYLIYNILSFLPAKAISKFKCVSKTWHSLPSDPFLINRHLQRSKMRNPKILILPSSHDDSLMIHSIKHGFQGGELVLEKSISGRASAMLKPVNGLIPLLDTTDYQSCVYNMGTQEMSPWVPTSLALQPRGSTLFPCYGFGFDPLTNKHKILCIWEISKSSPALRHSMFAGRVEYKCEVYTVGENEWRKIDAIPPVPLCKRAVYANGSIYRRNRGQSYRTPPEKELIVAFDLRTEKFRVVEIPDLIVDSFRGTTTRRAENLIQVDGHIALVDRESEYVLKLWISDDDLMRVNTKWNEETIRLPFSWEEGCLLTVDWVEGTDQLIIKSPIGSTANLFTYDRVTKVFQEIKITGIPPSPRTPFMYGLFMFRDSLLPVQDSGKKHDQATSSKIEVGVPLPPPFFHEG